MVSIRSQFLEGQTCKENKKRREYLLDILHAKDIERSNTGPKFLAKLIGISDFLWAIRQQSTNSKAQCICSCDDFLDLNLLSMNISENETQNNITYRTEKRLDFTPDRDVIEVYL